MIVPSYDCPAGSVFEITLPSPYYNSFNASSPPAQCSLAASSDYVVNCTNQTSPTNKIRFIASTFIAGATPISLTLIGMKNPSYVGTFGPGSFNLNIYHPNGKKINAGTFPNVTFVSPKSPDKIFMILGVTSYYKTVVADYSFQLQSSNTLPVGGTILVTFPANFLSVLSGFSSPSDIVGSWTSTKLLYTASYNSGTGILSITTQFEWPSKTTVTIKANGLTNPSIAKTGVFVASTQYDGVTLDQTDPSDPSNTISYLNYAPAISVSSSSIYPKNAGENSIVSMTMSSVQDIPANSQLQFDFPSSYGNILTTTDKSLVCTSGSFTATCYVENGKLIVPIDTAIPAGTTFDLQIIGLANPNVGAAGGISITTVKDGKAIQFTNNALTLNSTTPALNMQLTLLQTSSTNLEEKANYNLCGQTPGAIPINAQFYIDFPSQFNIRKPSYTCSLGASASNTLTYPNGAQCSVIQNMRRFIFTGQTNSYAGGTTQTYCFQIFNVQNPSDSGQSDSFTISVYDPATKNILYKAYGTLSYPTTISYQRVGLRIIIDSIPSFSKGIMSETIQVSLEQKVPYEVTLTPSCAGFDFLPQVIDFPAGTSIAYFNILPLASTNAGTYSIQWAKNEMNNGTGNKFAQVSDSYFTYLAKAPFNAYQALLSTTVSRTALMGNSLPITISLTQPAAQPVVLYFETVKPNQPEYINFNPKSITFLPGETSKNISYTTLVGAVSGIIRFSLGSPYDQLYYMPQTDVNFEILDVDMTPPSVVNEYIVELDRTYMYYRISTSESVWVYYLLTLKGTVKPPKDEVLDPTLRSIRNTKTDVIELSGKNSS